MNNFIELINLLTQQERGKIAVTIEKKMLYNEKIYEISVYFVDADKKVLEKQLQFSEEMFSCIIPEFTCDAIDKSAGEIMEYINENAL